MKKTNHTFSQILAAVAAENMQTLMQRAKTANRLAKTANLSGAKNRAYSVKVNALEGLRRNFPAQVKIKNDWKHGSEIVLIEIAESNFGLHAPARSFELEA